MFQSSPGIFNNGMSYPYRREAPGTSAGGFGHIPVIHTPIDHAPQFRLAVAIFHQKQKEEENINFNFKL